MSIKSAIMIINCIYVIYLYAINDSSYTFYYSNHYRGKTLRPYGRMLTFLSGLSKLWSRLLLLLC
uniref:Uncharacterized protein n=1 Tax=Rhizophora mucronata TaxID=61149 RepID=A0A2P2Q7A6_RHIMU